MKHHTFSFVKDLFPPTKPHYHLHCSISKLLQPFFCSLLKLIRQKMSHIWEKNDWWLWRPLLCVQQWNISKPKLLPGWLLPYLPYLENPCITILPALSFYRAWTSLTSLKRFFFFLFKKAIFRQSACFSFFLLLMYYAVCGEIRYSITLSPHATGNTNRKHRACISNPPCTSNGL